MSAGEQGLKPKSLVLRSTFIHCLIATGDLPGTDSWFTFMMNGNPDYNEAGFCDCSQFILQKAITGYELVESQISDNGEQVMTFHQDPAHQQDTFYFTLYTLTGFGCPTQEQDVTVQGPSQLRIMGVEADSTKFYVVLITEGVSNEYLIIELSFANNYYSVGMNPQRFTN